MKSSRRLLGTSLLVFTAYFSFGNRRKDISQGGKTNRLSGEDEVTIVRDLDRVQQSNAVDCSLVRQKPSGQKWAKFSQYWNVGALFHYFSESEVMVSFFRAEIVTS